MSSYYLSTDKKKKKKGKNKYYAEILIRQLHSSLESEPKFSFKQD